MREIDLATWNRAMHCQIFRNSVQPQYCVTFELDITNFLRKIRERGYSFTFSFVFAVTKCANEIEEFRCRFWEGRPVIYDKINTSFTYLDNGSELFKVVNVEMQDTIEEYVSLAANTVREQKECFTAPMGNDIYQFSSFPWVSFTHNILSVMKKLCFRFQYKYTILLLTVCISGNWRIYCRIILIISSK